MSRRAITRPPAKRMLVFFQEDCTTSIISTNKVRKIVGGGNKLQDGAVVVVNYENVDYEALIVKLHNDPTVLSQFEIEFMKTQQLGPHNNDNDKENNPVAVGPVSKRPKLTDKVKEAKPSKQKDKAKPKKIISIDAEIAPTDRFSPSNIEQSPSKQINQPGSLNFLDASEQVRVQRLLCNFRKGEGKEIGTQTEPLSEERTDSIAPKHFEGKSVQTESECHCSNIAESLKLLHEKIDFIHARPLQIENQTVSQPVQWSQPDQWSQVFNNQDVTVENDTTASLPIVSPASRSIHAETELQELQPMCNNSSPAFKSSVFEETYKESSSMCNYAKNLVFKLFARHELEGTNCAGVKGKRSLEKEQRMELIKEATFKQYCVEDKKKSWALCRKAIDCAIRHLKPLQ